MARERLNEELTNLLGTISGGQKIALFYELAKELKDVPAEDDDMENLFNDIATVVNDIDNL